MTIKYEHLLENLLDLERARQRERSIRIESEALLQGLREVAQASGRNALFQTLVRTLKNLIPFEDAFILEEDDDETMSVLISTSAALEKSTWKPQSLFKRALRGQPRATFDISLVPEWNSQPDRVTQSISSAMHIGLLGAVSNNLLVITHSKERFFTPNHLRQAKRFSPFASQTIRTLELQKSVLQRDRFFQISMDMMAILDADGTLKQSNNLWYDILGFSKDDIYKKQIFDFIHPEDLGYIRTVLNSLHEGPGKKLVDVRFCKKDGEYRWFSCSLTSYRDEQLCYIVARDITANVMFTQGLAYDASHDSLTGLTNRAGFLSCLTQAYSKAQRNKNYIFALFFLDLDNFKAVNDTFGHDIGDELLKIFSRSLKEIVREKDVVARFGGDEFTILLDDIQTQKTVITIAKRTQEVFQNQLIIKGQTINTSTSIGIAMSTSKYKDANAMLKAADQAMYKAKSARDKNYIICE